LLAKEGLTAAGNVIELFAAANGGGEAELAKLAESDAKFKIMQTGIKPYACEFMMHTWIEAVLKLSEEHNIRPDDIEAIHVKTFKRAVELAGSEAYKPMMKEKADHGGPCCLAIALLEGGVGPANSSPGSSGRTRRCWTLWPISVVRRTLSLPSRFLQRVRSL
jgi:2-methylcitrate dehydratase